MWTNIDQNQRFLDSKQDLNIHLHPRNLQEISSGSTMSVPVALVQSVSPLMFTLCPTSSEC